MQRPIGTFAIENEKIPHALKSRRDFLCVHLIGLEPTRPKTPDPKSGASTNSATGALRLELQS